MVSEDLLVNTGVQQKRIDIGEKGVQEVFADAWPLPNP
jgi:hypothetical protein